MNCQGILRPLAGSQCLFMAAVMLVACVNGKPAAAQFEQDVAEELTGSTVLVVTISIERSKDIERNQVEELLKQVDFSGAEEFVRAYDDLMVERDKFDKMGVTDVGMIIDGIDGVNGMPRMIYHVESGKNIDLAAQQLMDLFQPREKPKVVREKGIIAIGEPSDVAAGDAQRARFQELTKLSPNAIVRFCFVPSDDQLRVLRELVPSFPPPFDRFNGEMLAQAAQSGVLSISGEPAMELKVMTIGKDQAATEQFVDAVHKLKDSVAPFQQMLPPNIDLATLIDRVQQVDGKSYASLAFSSDDDSLTTAMEFLLPPIAAARSEARRMQDMNTLKQLGLAQHNYHDTFKGFAPRYSVDDEGKPLLSWRVLVLPFLDQNELYKQFHLDEPWDSEHNRKLISKMPQLYRSTSLGNQVEEGKTVFQGIVMEGAMFGERELPRLRDVKDGTSNTILLVEAPAELAVPWTKPADVELEYDDLVELLKKQPGFNALFGDGSVRYLSSDVLPELLKKLLTYDGGEATQ